MAGPRANVVFIHTDSWDGRVLGCMGHSAMAGATPNIDRLAGRGVLFSNTYCSHPICCPSRANMWSGTYTQQCQSWNNHKGLERGTETFKDRLERAGYRFATEEGGYGKHDYWSGRHSQLARVTAWTANADIRLPVYRMGAPEVIDDERRDVHVGDWNNAERGKQFLREHAGDAEPFFLYVGLNMPHPSFTTSRYWLDRVDESAVTLPPEDGSDHAVMSYQRINKNWQWGLDEETIRKTRAIYYAMCSECDAAVGSIVDEVERLGLGDSTYVVFGSDHGENNLEHGQYYKMNFYESSVRVPLVVAGPGIERGTVVDNVVSLIDLYPTFMELAGRGDDVPENLDGESLVGLMTGSDRSCRDWAYASFTGTTMNTTGYMLRKGRYKYIAYAGCEGQLFDLVDDPDEVRNLVSARPEVVAEMDASLRGVVDYDEVHDRCMAYNRESFTRWRAELREHPIHLREYGADIESATYEQVMANCYLGWNDEAAQQLEAWLTSPSASRAVER